MFNPFKSLGDMNEMRAKAQEMQQKLAQQRVVVDRDGVHIVMTGDQHILEFSQNNASNDQIMDVLNEAIMKSQQVAAMQLQSMA
jgi:DNA-binding protein YbaB